jgi:hypothetical protein
MEFWHPFFQNLIFLVRVWQPAEEYKNNHQLEWFKLRKKIMPNCPYNLQQAATTDHITQQNSLKRPWAAVKALTSRPILDQWVFKSQCHPHDTGRRL